MIIDWLTKLGEVRVVKGPGAKEIGEGLNLWERKYGRPELICCDAVQANRSKAIREWGDKRGAQLEFSPPFHHASLGS